MDLFLLSRESGLRVATLPERGIFKVTLRTWYNMHLDTQRLYFLESLIHPLEASLKVSNAILLLNRVINPYHVMNLFKIGPLFVSHGKLLISQQISSVIIVFKDLAKF